jgi:D-alanyl-D-alanine-carboxypeptidase/D-alanyl-D-alanine-endopeptidase
MKARPPILATLARTLALALALALALVLAAAANAASAPTLAPTHNDAALRDLARAWLQETDGVGLSIGIHDAGQRRFVNAGVPRLDSNRPVTKDTIYEIGPVGRTFTGQLLARAIIEGRVAAQDDVAKYLGAPYPNLENGGERVRLVHLVNMTSGLADNIPDVTQLRPVPREPMAVTHMRVFNAYTRLDFLRQLTRVRPRRPPGSEAGSQSRVANVLLGAALEGAYGEPFAKLLAREIEKPLRLGSGVAPDPKRLARGHTAAGEELPAYDAVMSQAADSLRYSANDLLTFAAWQLAERDASVKLAHQPTWTAPGGRQAVAFTWIVGEAPQGRRLIVAGETWGFASLCVLYPDARLAIVLLANKNADGAQESLRALSARIVEVLRPGAVTNPSSSADAPPPGP